MFGFGFFLKLKQSLFNCKAGEVGVERKGLFLEPNVHYWCLPYFLHAKGMGLREYPQSIKNSNTIELILWLQNELRTAQDTHSKYSMHANMQIHAYHSQKKTCQSNSAVIYWQPNLLLLYSYNPLKILWVWQTYHTVLWIKKNKILINPI